jgi:uncharacterized glyoxalase superfamily protein PhnB
MNANANDSGTTVVPALRYRDLPAAIEWLCNAFGFERHLVVAGEDGVAHYAQLTLGNGMVMLGPVHGSAFDELMRQPDEIGNAETQICYFYVADAVAHYARAKAAGAEIVLDITDESNGGRGYSCRDPQGHIWNFGTFNPWRRQQARTVPPPERSARRNGRPARMALSISVVALVVAAGWIFAPTQLDRIETAVAAPPEQVERQMLARERAAREAAERQAKDMREQLAKERIARVAAERLGQDARELLIRERGVKEAVERAGLDGREQLARERGAKEAAERSVEELRDLLARERSKPAAEPSGPQTQAQLDAERAARLKAEEAAEEARGQLAAEQNAREAAERVAKETRDILTRERQAKATAERSAREAQGALSRERSKRAAEKSSSGGGFFGAQ